MKRLLLIPLVLFLACEEKDKDKHGCLDSQACNYNSDATIDNNSCIYKFDCSGDCGGVDTTCVGCDGVVNSGFSLDSCGTCDNDTTNDCPADCNADFEGLAYLDNCDECVGGETGNEANYTMDGCGVCGGSGFAFDNDFEQKWKLLYGETDNEEWLEWNNPDTYSMGNNSYILDINCDSFSIIWKFDEENPYWEFSGHWNPIEAPSEYSFLDLIFIDWDWQEVPQSYIDYYEQSAPEFVGYNFLNDSLKIYYNSENYFGIDTYIAQLKFSLEDLNPVSETYGMNIGPQFFNEKVTLYYFPYSET